MLLPNPYGDLKMDSADRSTQKDTSSSAVTSSLIDLIARLEKATGPDRELDGDICAALGLHPDGWRRGVKEASADAIWFDDRTRRSWSASAFTSSIDAAMSLVPEGWNRRASETDKHWWWAELREGYETSYNRVEIGQSPSLPVSICIAALKARSLPAI